MEDHDRYLDKRYYITTIYHELFTGARRLMPSKQHNKLMGEHEIL